MYFNLEKIDIAQASLLTYLRYNARLTPEYIREDLGLDMDAKQVRSLSAMDDPENMIALQTIGRYTAESQVCPKDSRRRST